MAEDTDFAALYRTLGITPACTPVQFRQAYRRAVARLHPDPRGGGGDVAELQELNRLYRAATEFQRIHGRLPGAPPMPADAQATAAFAPAAAAAPHAMPATPTEAPAEDAAGIDRMSRYFILLALLAIVALALHALETGGGKAGPDAAAPQRAMTGERSSPDAKIVLGMEKARVKAIQGAPLGMHEIRWDYGPSWIDFGCGGVVTDWYSSPLRPLRVATPHPTAGDWDAFDAAPPPGC